MGLPRADYLIVSCEHGGNRVPPRYRHLLSPRFLATHRGFDAGALDFARDVARAAGAPLFYSTVSRLLVELNRPLDHPQVFYLDFPPTSRQALLRRYYLPYWSAIESGIARALRRGRRVLHLSCHSFTPKFAGVRRTTDVGLLFDPARPAESRFCRSWRNALRRQAPRLRIRYNDPYPGAFPSVVHAMRGKFAASRYVGIQLEINQKFPRGKGTRWQALRRLLVQSLQQALADFRAGA